ADKAAAIRVATVLTAASTSARDCLAGAVDCDRKVAVIRHAGQPRAVPPRVDASRPAGPVRLLASVADRELAPLLHALELLREATPATLVVRSSRAVADGVPGVDVVARNEMPDVPALVAQADIVLLAPGAAVSELLLAEAAAAFKTVVVIGDARGTPITDR